jgi:DNA processing protein
VSHTWERCISNGIEVHVVATSRRFAHLAADIDPPAIVFTRGDPVVVHGRRVAIVGTRNASADARRVAASLGRDLAAAGVHVVSGLARGIDGGAHRGALESCAAGPIGVVASGLDVVYPPEHKALWNAVATHGLLLSEAPPGTPPEPFRFPQRNRILAALSEVVVVVESRATGGSLITVDAALERQVPVMAVPGSLRNPAAAGTNALLRDGAAAVLDAGDVLAVLGLDHRRANPPADPRPSLLPGDHEILTACSNGGRTLDQLILLTSRSVADVAICLARLEGGGWLAEVDGWFETVGSPR